MFLIWWWSCSSPETAYSTVLQHQCSWREGVSSSAPARPPPEGARPRPHLAWPPKKIHFAKTNRVTTFIPSARSSGQRNGNLKQKWGPVLKIRTWSKYGDLKQKWVPGAKWGPAAIMWTQAKTGTLNRNASPEQNLGRLPKMKNKN